MNLKEKTRFNMVSYLGIAGIFFVILYFLFANLSRNTAYQFQEHGEYSLFYKLYGNLGYKIENHYRPTLPNQKNSVLIYLDCVPNKEELDKIIRQWVEPGGVLFIVGINSDCDPVSSAQISESSIQSIYTVNESSTNLMIGFTEQTFRYLSTDDDFVMENVILSTEMGPLLYGITKGKGTVFVLSDSELLKDKHLCMEKVAIFFNSIFKPYFAKEFFVVRSDFREVVDTSTPVLVLFFKDRLIFVTLQLIWIMLLFFAWQGKRFGQPQLLDPYAKRTISEHLRAVGHFYQKTNAARIIDRINTGYFKHMINKLMGFRFRTSIQANKSDQIIEYISSVVPEFSEQQIRRCLDAGGSISTNLLLDKEQLQDEILEALTKKRLGLNKR